MTTLPRSKPRATISIQTLLPGFDGLPVSIAAVFGCVGTSVSPPWLWLNDVVVVVVVGTVVVVVVVVDEVVVVVDEDELVVVVVDEDELLVVEDEVSPSQPWLSVTTALELSASPSYVTKTLPPSPAVRLARSCQLVKKWNEPWPC